MAAEIRTITPAELYPWSVAVRAAAVTQVTTTATHRRQGLAHRLVTADLAAACRERGEPLSILIAAEWPIYGRWGYGPATEVQTFTLDPRQTRIIGSSAASVHLVDLAGSVVKPRTSTTGSGQIR